MTTPVKRKPEIYDVTIRNITDFGNETRHFEFYYPNGKTMDFIPGQFVTLWHEDGGKLIRRAYSIASSPLVRDHFDLCLKLVHDGAITPWLWTLKEGAVVKIQGPFGKFVLPDPLDFDPIFVATGTGIAPFRSMIHTLLENGCTRRVALLFGSRFENMIPYQNEWLDLKKRYANFTYTPTISRPQASWQGESGYVQLKIEKHFPKATGKKVYICGLNAMIQSVKEACLKQGYTEDQVLFERYD